MTMQRWEPMREMMTLRNAMDRLFEESIVRPSLYWPDIDAGSLSIDMYQMANDVVLKASLPGFKPEEVDISISGDDLTIKGDNNEEEEAKEEDYFFKERRYRSFSRTVTLPMEVKSEKAEATFDNGVLTLTMPKAEVVKPKQIKVKAKAAIEGEKKTEARKKWLFLIQ
jgi:HSP20 family protein